MPIAGARATRSALLAVVVLVASSAAFCQPLTVPFDFSRSEIGVDAAVANTALHVIIDTGVDPSLVDLDRAKELGFRVHRGEGGEASGFGEGRGARVFPTRIRGLAIGTRTFGGFAALATDLGPLSAHYGRKLDMVLGYSFLVDKAVLVDYPQRTVSILARAGEADASTRSCRVKWSSRLTTVDSFPVIRDFRFGSAHGAATIDTGSNGNISLYRNALGLPGVRDALLEDGTVVRSGARGEQTSGRFRFAASLGFGPFTLPQGQAVTTYGGKGPNTAIVANVGNALFDALRVRMLLDYRARTMTFFGDCE